MNSYDLRKKYLNFFKERGHAIIPSSSLVPDNDSTTLFVGSGMQPLIPYLLGESHPLGKRLTNSQKSFRAEDIEEVGDGRHTTFFEMLGNWSLGDYFKKEQLKWIFEFLTEELKINPEKLYVTVFRGNKKIGIERDHESVKIWKEIFSSKKIEAKDIDFAEKNGMQKGRIFYYDETKNWWSRSGMPENMPIGEPGGPDSEIFYDLGEELKHHEKSIWKNEKCHVNCDCGRFIEIGNSVFMEYIKTEKGFESLPQKNVDFGGGLERIAMASQGKTNVYETDLFSSIIKKIEELSNIRYENNSSNFEIIADHTKGSIFLASSDILPSNTERGYILRRLIRRAVRFGKLINMPSGFLEELGKEVIKIYKEVYPELELKEADTLSIIKKEEEKFEKTIEKGIVELKKIIDWLKNQGFSDSQGGGDSNDYTKKTSEELGKKLFFIYQSYGFPLELSIEEIEKLSEWRIFFKEEVISSFKKEFEKHREVSKIGATKKFGGVGKNAGEKSIKFHTATHLLHQSLRDILGPHVQQMGSDITSERLRFDFSHHSKMTEEEIKKTEDLINKKIEEDLEVKKEEMLYKEALKSGAMAFFKEKYPEKVNVYSVGKFSKEICAGPHVKKTSDIGRIKIIKEESSGAGIRRIKAIIED